MEEGWDMTGTEVNRNGLKAILFLGHERTIQRHVTAAAEAASQETKKHKEPTYNISNPESPPKPNQAVAKRKASGHYSSIQLRSPATRLRLRISCPFSHSLSCSLHFTRLRPHQGYQHHLHRHISHLLAS